MTTAPPVAATARSGRAVPAPSHPAARCRAATPDGDELIGGAPAARCHSPATATDVSASPTTTRGVVGRGSRTSVTPARANATGATIPNTPNSPGTTA